MCIVYICFTHTLIHTDTYTHTYTHTHTQTHTGVLVSGVNDNCDNSQVVEAINTAVTILEIVSGILLPGLPDVHATVRIGLHMGEWVWPEL